MMYPMMQKRIYLPVLLFASALLCAQQPQTTLPEAPAPNSGMPPTETVSPEDLDISAARVLENYLAAIGGKDKLAAVKSIAMLATANVQGSVLELWLKKTAQDQFMQDITMMGNVMSRQVLNGNEGYVLVQGQERQLGPEEIARIKEEAVPFPEMYYLKKEGITLLGVESFGEKKAYALKITENKTNYYDVETGLKLREVNKAEIQGQQMTQVLAYYNYDEVAGIYFPMLFVQSTAGQNVEFNVGEILVNEGVTDADFE
ncbi:hypothetical protein [Maribacter sp. 2307ULW6-5]|uniref:hypothetical protein n=1 Tax=Maribacter sp. 2307ULW6-5 TaxID=3386275 RepID=UPI0039BC968B